MIRGRPFGLEVRVGLGWVLSYLLIAATLMLWFGLPDVTQVHPAVRFVAVIAVPALLLPTVVAHELAHALTARRRGAAVETVDLRLVGVPVHGDMSGRDPVTEALVAIAGPAVSGSVGMAALVLAALAERVGSDEAALAAWVCTCIAAGNLLLAAISMYPGAPMDGGQLVHAIARRTTRDAATASRRAGAVGIAAGWAVMFLGLAIAVTVDSTAGLWLTLMGWFLGRASRLARGQEQLIRITAGLHVRDAIADDIGAVSPFLTLDTLLAQHQLAGGGPDVYPVGAHDAPVGVIDIRSLRGIPASQRKELRVADRMRPLESLRSVREDQELWDAVALLEQGRQGAVRVVATFDPGQLLGLVTRASVTRLLRSRRRPMPDDTLP